MRADETGKECHRGAVMEDTAKMKTIGGQSPWTRSSRFQKERQFQTVKYLEVLAHYDAKLIQNEGPITFVRSTTGAELPFEGKAKLLMLQQLLKEFGSIDGTNEAVKQFKSLRR